jgi:Protein of unknown function (DUF2752)
VVSETIAEAAVAGTARRGARLSWLRALGVTAAWVVSALPVLLGRASCPMADIFGVPCPGCGMTRAVMLLARGDLAASVQMHALALPSLIASVLFMAATVWTTALRGHPLALWQTRLGRVACIAFGAVQAAVLGLWIARMMGAFGGPVAV